MGRSQEGRLIATAALFAAAGKCPLRKEACPRSSVTRENAAGEHQQRGIER